MIKIPGAQSIHSASIVSLLVCPGQPCPHSTALGELRLRDPVHTPQLDIHDISVMALPTCAPFYLWLAAQDLNEVKPGKNPAWMGWGLREGAISIDGF